MRTLTDHLTQIDGVSDRLAGEIVDAFPTYDRLAGASVDELTAVKGVGPVLAARIQEAAAAQKPATATATKARQAATKATNGKATTATRTAKRTTAQATGTAKKATGELAARADKAADVAARRASRVAEDAEQAAATATGGVATATDAAADATERVSRDFTESLDRREFGPITVPANLPFPINKVVDLTAASVSFGLNVTTGVLRAITRRLR
jgi:hypothetical protein